MKFQVYCFPIVWSLMSLPNQNSYMILWLSFCVGPPHIAHPVLAVTCFHGGGLLCTHLEMLWTCLSLSTAWLEHMSLNRESVQSCVLSWTSPGSSVADKNTGIGYQSFRRKVPIYLLPPNKRYPECHQTQGKCRRLHVRTETIKLLLFSLQI